MHEIIDAIGSRIATTLWFARTTFDRGDEVSDELMREVSPIVSPRRAVNKALVGNERRA